MSESGLPKPGWPDILTATSAWTMIKKHAGKTCRKNMQEKHAGKTCSDKVNFKFRIQPNFSDVVIDITCKNDAERQRKGLHCGWDVSAIEKQSKFFSSKHKNKIWREKKHTNDEIFHFNFGETCKFLLRCITLHTWSSSVIYKSVTYYCSTYSTAAVV